MDGNLFTRLRKGATAALAAAGALFATACATIADPVAAQRVEGPALWKVADRDTTIYLFGTVHALPKDVPWMRGAIGPALERADTFVSEVDLTNADPSALARVVAEKAILPEGETLRGLLDPDQRAAYEAALAKLGLQAAAFDRYEPWFATLQLVVQSLSKGGVLKDNGVETTLSAQVGNGKAREALETAEFQLSIFDELPQDAQIDYLMKVVEGNADIRAALDAMLAEWMAGDAEGLAKLLNEDFESDKALLEKLLYQRNRNWAGWIADRLDTPGTVFVAVGAGHLAGKGSVQDALKARGIRSVRVQ